jgi:DNA-binding NtrC family response regulator
LVPVSGLSRAIYTGKVHVKTNPSWLSIAVPSPKKSTDDELLRYIEAACGGTLYFDEVAEIPWDFQGKLVGALHERFEQATDSNHTSLADIRIISATSGDLPQLVSEKQFRQDLYLRINVAKIDVPPFRDRREDIHGIFYHFVETYVASF